MIYTGSGNKEYSTDNGVLYSKDKKTLVAYPSGKTETSFIIPDSVTFIENSAFSGCASLANVTMPDSVTYIGNDAFRSCTSLANVTIPDSVTYIGDNAFRGCTSLSSVTFQGTIPSSRFYNTSDDQTFSGDLRDKFYATDKAKGTPGTYTRATDGETWTRQ
jgi:hypothetical protein